MEKYLLIALNSVHKCAERETERTQSESESLLIVMQFPYRLIARGNSLECLL